MKVTEIRDEPQWEPLEAVWNRLLDASSSGTTFLTWEWVRTWWSAYGTPGDLRILVATDDGGIIRGIAPLRRATLRGPGQKLDALTFIGDGSNDSDYLDVIIERSFEERVLSAWLRHIGDTSGRARILRLNEIPASSPTVPLLRKLAPDSLWEQRATQCPTVHLPAQWDEYLALLRPRFRTKVRSVLRNLENRQEVRFGFCEDVPQLERLLPSLFDLHTRRWNHDGQPGVFGWDRKRRFYAELSRQLLERGSLRLSWLEWNDRVLACQYGFVHGSTYFHLQEGYEPMSEHWNIGVGLRAWTIREFLRSGIDTYDFLAGAGRHKSDWGAILKESHSVTMAMPTYQARAFFYGAEWRKRAKDAVRRIAPDRILAMRQRFHERPRATTQAGNVRTHVRQAAARCYFHLGGPSASRLLRDRYEASVGTDGRVIRGSWRRRQEPSGRILYCRRINNENDPFFPSTPIEVFDRQMRHVARHYKVVSLGGLVDHLASGTPSTVLAITFDDGYRDNYENAFPILQRYGLPATIFLTTGSVDSREPLWFEELAGTVKTTPKEFLDLELDIPRRLWLRTEPERLRANDELFGLLRRMPDEERQQWLARIFKELGRPEVARRDKMLTWDEVRLMNPRGIDFGSHTVTHPYLSRLTREQVAWEVSECKRRIESELQKPVAHFAYPNGREEDFAPWNKELIHQAGYQAAVTTVWGLNFPATDRLQLRRGGAWEQDEALFAYKMDWYHLVNG